jgi:hypothetical protein
MAAVAAGAVLLSGVAAQATEKPTGAKNLEGVWKIAAPTAALKPVSGAVPFTAEGRKRFEANKKLRAKGAFDDYDIARSRCSAPGVPRLMLTGKRFKIWQRQGVVTFDFEWNQAIRQIDLRGVEKEPPLVPDMAGASNGRWEGDTLIAVTTDMSERALLDELIPHTDAIKVTERYRLVDADTLENRITIEDPAYFTKPWDAVITYKRQPEALFPEDVCLDRLWARQPIQPSS